MCGKKLCFGLLALVLLLGPLYSDSSAPPVSEMTEAELLAEAWQILEKEKTDLTAREKRLTEREADLSRRETDWENQKKELIGLRQLLKNYKNDMKDEYWRGFRAGGITFFAVGTISGFITGFKIRI